MAVLCGKCHEHHETVDDVRRCFSALPTASTTQEEETVSVEARGENFFLTDSAQNLYDNHAQEMERQQREVHKDRIAELRGDHPGHESAPQVPQTCQQVASTATAAQLKFIVDLRRQKGLDELEFTGSKKQASEEIDRLRAMPNAARKTSVKMERTNISPWEDIPQGRYALLEHEEYWVEETDEGPSDEFDVWRFYHISHGTKGTRWEGFTFVDIIHGDETTPIKNSKRKEEILSRIRADPKKAASDFGKEIGACGICGRQLTNPASIETGIGPICAQKVGW